jgi:hypothetical protein
MPEELNDEMTAAIMTVVYFISGKDGLTPGEVKARYQEFRSRVQSSEDPKAKEKLLTKWANQ